MKIHADLAGNRYSMLTAVRCDPSRTAERWWLFRCDCGQEKFIRARHVLSGATTSCGGHGRRKGLVQIARKSSMPGYHTWKGMHRRCYSANDPKYPRYGARGITVCAEWSDFDVFIKDMGLRPEGMTLDRRDNDGPYAPWNCRWATPEVQGNNRGTVRPALGVSSLRKLAREAGVAYYTLYHHVVLRGREPAAVLAYMKDGTPLPTRV